MDQGNSAPTLEQFAAKKLIEIILNIFEISRQRKQLLCYCHKFDGIATYSVIEFPVCSVCQICKLLPFWFQERARKDLRYLIETYRHIVKLKNCVLRHNGHRDICFNHDYEYTFMGGLVSQNIGLYGLISPYKIHL